MLYIHPDAITAELDDNIGSNSGKLDCNGGDFEPEMDDRHEELKGTALAVFHAIMSCPTAKALEISEIFELFCCGDLLPNNFLCLYILFLCIAKESEHYGKLCDKCILIRRLLPTYPDQRKRNSAHAP